MLTNLVYYTLGSGATLGDYVVNIGKTYEIPTSSYRHYWYTGLLGNSNILPLINKIIPVSESGEKTLYLVLRSNDNYTRTVTIDITKNLSSSYPLYCQVTYKIADKTSGNYSTIIIDFNSNCYTNEYGVDLFATIQIDRTGGLEPYYYLGLTYVYAGAAPPDPLWVAHYTTSFDENQLDLSDVRDFYTLFTSNLLEANISENDTSQIGGGTGTYDFSSDVISSPSVPTITGSDTAFFTVYQLSQAQMAGLGHYLWNSLNISLIKLIYSSPIENIIGCFIFPVPPDSDDVETKNLIIANLDTEIAVNRVKQPYKIFDCGTITVTEKWGSILDYEPYTKTTLYLPFIGMRTIKTDDIMGKSVNIKYYIDFQTGICNALVIVDNQVLYTFNGNCAATIPITQSDMSNTVKAAITIAGASIVAVATGGASVAATVAAAGTAVNNLKPSIQRSGNLAGNSGFLGVNYPYFIFECPRQSLANEYNKFDGYPSNITAILSTLHGYTVVEKIHLENLTATADEISEIESLLKEGVLL